MLLFFKQVRISPTIKTSGVLRGDASRANRDYVSGPLCPPPLKRTYVIIEFPIFQILVHNSATEISEEEDEEESPGDDRTGMDSFLYLGCSCSWLALPGVWWCQAEQGNTGLELF